MHVSWTCWTRMLRQHWMSEQQTGFEPEQAIDDYGGKDIEKTGVFLTEDRNTHTQ